MTASYVLGADIDLSGVANFIPIGASGSGSANAGPTPFTGTFDGAGHTITGLTQVSASNSAGLFGLIGSGGSVMNLRLENAQITSNYAGGSAANGNPSPGMIGILAGENAHGSIANVTVSGTIADNSPGSACGGLVGVNMGSISASSATVALSAVLKDSDSGLTDQSTQIGGIAGRNNGAITNVGAAGTISVQLDAAVSARAIFGAQIGGLIGLSGSAGELTGSNSSVNISAAFSGSAYATSADNPYTAYWNAIGGLVGNAPSTSTIVNSFSSGTITVTDAVKPEGGLAIDTVGGLLGSGGTIGNGGNINPAGTPTLTGSSASGPIKATGLCCAPYGATFDVGGLVGVFNGKIISSYASGSVDVTGESYNGVGGLVAQIESGTLTDVNASSSVTSVSTGLGNDVGGLAGTSGAIVTNPIASTTVTNAIASGRIVSNVTVTLPINGNGMANVDSTVGGLVGFNHGVIKNAIALGSVTATFAGSVAGSGSSYNDQVAGLVANNDGPVSSSSAWGAVSLTSTVSSSNGGTSTQMAGGLVGGGFIGFGGISTVTNSFSTGAVSASGVNDLLMVGSLMGYSTGSIASSYALGKPSVQGGSGNNIGGLVGRNDAGGTITSSYWDVNQTGVESGVGSGAATGATSWVAAPTSIPAGFDPAIWGLTPTVDSGYPCL